MWVNDHPGRAEPVPQHTEAKCEKRLPHRHEDLTAIGEKCMNALGLFAAVDCEREICAPHRLETFGRSIATHELRLSDGHADMEDVIFLLGGSGVRRRHLAVSHLPCDFS